MVPIFVMTIIPYAGILTLEYAPGNGQIIPT
jgi:hypothetical protein